MSDNIGMKHVFAVLAFLSAFLPVYASGSEGLEIGRMRVAVWPEYDSTGVLFIYDGRFKNNELFPNESVFLIPSGSVISDACSLSPKGQHFCQLYKQKRAGGMDEVTLNLPYPNFYLSFHTDPFAGEGKRVLSHVIKAAHRIERLEVDIQSPLRAEGFRVLSPVGFETSESKGFTHFERAFENVNKGDEIVLRIEYVKNDSRPSVDIKYSPSSMSGKAATSPYQRQKGVYALAYVVVFAGAVLLAALIFIAVRSKGR